jgi:hypothetical protein
MTFSESPSESPPVRSLRACLSRLGRRLWTGLGFLLQLAAVVWGMLALSYTLPLPGFWLRVAAALAFAAFGAWALWLAHRPRMRLAFAGLFLVVLAWFVSIRPSHDRPWRPEAAVMPRATIDGDRVTFTGFRNFEYRSRDDFTVRYEEREILLSHLTSVDLFVSYWKPGPVAHTFLSFNFDNAPPVCISVEFRPEKGERYGPVASLFKQFELIYIVGDERDLVGVRTNYRGEEVYLYRIRTSPEDARRLFLVYLERINELAERPEFYHLLRNSCTVNIVRHANVSGRAAEFHISHLLNGLIDRHLYHTGLVDTTLPFDELRRRSRINEAAQADERSLDFSRRIRAAIPSPGSYR